MVYMTLTQATKKGTVHLRSIPEMTNNGENFKSTIREGA